MEDLTTNPELELKRIVQFLELYEDNNRSLKTYKIIELVNRLLRKVSAGNRINIKMNNNVILSIVNNRSFEKMTKGRKKNEEDVKSHYRKGVPGDWKNHFKDLHVKMFDEKYPGLIKKLGY